MTTAAFSLEVAPVGNVNSDAPQSADPTQHQTDLQLSFEDDLRQRLVPILESIQLQTRFAHVGSVNGFELLGPRFAAVSDSNECLVLLHLQLPGIDQDSVADELQKALPDGPKVAALGEFTSLTSFSS
jgi:hypothetical protein